jgi:hypothetical protein
MKKKEVLFFIRWNTVVLKQERRNVFEGRTGSGFAVGNVTIFGAIEFYENEELGMTGRRVAHEGAHQ